MPHGLHFNSIGGQVSELLRQSGVVYSHKHNDIVQESEVDKEISASIVVKQQENPTPVQAPQHKDNKEDSDEEIPDFPETLGFSLSPKKNKKQLSPKLSAQTKSPPQAIPSPVSSMWKKLSSNDPPPIQGSSIPGPAGELVSKIVAKQNMPPMAPVSTGGTSLVNDLLRKRVPPTKPCLSEKTKRACFQISKDKGQTHQTAPPDCIVLSDDDS